MSLRRVVVITGCDSGLGWATAASAARAGLVTVAGVRCEESDARAQLASYCAHTVQLDVTDAASVDSFKNYITKLLRDNSNYRLYALINNAGVMTAGEFEWLTPGMIESQVAVNLTGLMRVTSALLPELRRAAGTGEVKPRLINIGSHCGIQPLPKFAAYSATKSGVIAFTSALRIELKPYGVSTVTFIPGSFVGHSRIMARQTRDFQEMEEKFDPEQRTFYAAKLAAIKNYLCIEPPAHSALEKEQVNTIKTLMKAVNDEDPKTMYKVECWRYKLYFFFFALPLPEFLRSWLVHKYVNLPDAPVGSPNRS